MRRDPRAEIDWDFTLALTSSMTVFCVLGMLIEAADPLLDTTPPAAVLAFRALYEAPEPPAPTDAPPEPTLQQEEPTHREEATERPAAPRVARATPSSDSAPAAGSRAGSRVSLDEARARATELLGSVGVGPLGRALEGGVAVGSATEFMGSLSDESIATRPSATGLTAREGSERASQTIGEFRDQVPTRAVEEGGPPRERPVRVALATPTVHPGPVPVPQDPVTRAIRHRVAAIRRCYERTLADHPSARGRLVMGFRVEGTGAFTNVTVVENDTGDSQLGPCLGAILGRLRITPTTGMNAATFRYPFVFEPQ